MKIKILLIVLLIVSFASSCQSQNQSLVKFKTYRLEQAEKRKNIKEIKKLFLKNALIIVPDSSPIVGIDAISSHYDYLWKNSNNELVTYLVKGVKTTRYGIIESGISITKSNKQKIDTIAFKFTFLNIRGNYLISELRFENA